MGSDTLEKLRSEVLALPEPERAQLAHENHLDRIKPTTDPVEVLA